MTSALPSSASDFQKLCQHSEKSNVEAMARISGFYSVYECALRRGFVHWHKKIYSVHWPPYGRVSRTRL